jgi:YebC/PmpR family DNA-binding regulatory protein
MSGHSRWATIKRKKAASDARRGKLFTQLIRELAIASRQGGPDPAGNPRLRLAIEKARAASMPKENIERAVRKGSGGGEGEVLEEIRYEGYGPGGVALIVDAVTDNRNRTGGEIRHLFSRHGGNLGASGCVAFQFERRGVLEFARTAVDAERLLEAAIDAGAADVIEDADTITAQTEPEAFEAVKRALESSGFAPQTAELQMVPQTTLALGGREAETMLRLYEALDEHEDVSRVWANFDISEDEMARASRA